MTSPIISTPPTSYVPAVDGLRALAVLAVIIYHADPAWLSGGYAGVDVFFVISGFLITRIIRAGRAEGRSLWHFWDRRIRRIFPPLMFLLAAMLLAGWLLMAPAELRGLGASAFASLVSVANVYFWLSSGSYFDLAAPLQPLLHLWSLGVEEQFYLLYPIALVLVLRFAPHRLWAAISVGMAISFTAAWYAAYHHPVAAFYLPFFRAWELLAGCALALSRVQAPRGHTADLLCVAALSALMIAFVFFDDAIAWPGPGTLVVVAASLALIWAAPKAGIMRQLLSAWPLVNIGLISYALYLWHHALFAFVRAVWPNALEFPEIAAIIMASFVLSGLSYRLIERPTRDRTRTPPRVFYPALLLIACALSSVAFIAWRTDGAPDRLPPRLRAVADMTEQYPRAIDPCFFPADGSRPFERSCLLGAAGPTRMAIVGDSHAMALAPGFRRVLQEGGVSSRLLIAAGCPPVSDLRVMSKLQHHCAGFNRSVYRWIEQDQSIRVVAIAARWPYLFDRTFYDNGEGGVEIGPNDGLLPDSDRDNRLEENLRYHIDRLLDAGKTVILVYPVPEPGWDVPKFLVHEYLRKGRTEMPSIDEGRWRARAAAAVAMLDRMGAHNNIIRVRPADAICGREQSGRCVLGDTSWPYYFDDDHPNREGADAMINQILRRSGERRRILDAIGRMS